MPIEHAAKNGKVKRVIEHMGDAAALIVVQNPTKEKNRLPSQKAVRGAIRAEGRRAGFVIDMPSLFDERSARTTREWIYFFDAIGGRILCLDETSKAARNPLREMGFVVPSGDVVEKVMLPAALRGVLAHNERKLYAMPSLVMGADTPSGQAWAWRLAQHVHELILCGDNVLKMRRLADELLLETGTAAYVTGAKEKWVSELELVVFADTAAARQVKQLSSGAIGIWCPRTKEPKRKRGTTLLSGGLVEWPNGYEAGDALSFERKRMLTDAFACHSGIRPNRIDAWQCLEQKGFACRGALINGCGVLW